MQHARDMVHPADLAFWTGNDRTIGELIGASASILDARDGDLKRLEKRRRMGIDLLEEEHELLAERQKQLAHRPTRNLTALRSELIAKFVAAYVALGGKVEAAVADAREHYKVSRSTVFSAMKRERERRR
jgi:hypothetical protein